MNAQDQLMDLLQGHNFDLIRQRKHKIYRNPDGITFVIASTPSDRRASQNALSTLRKILNPVNITAFAIPPLTALPNESISLENAAEPAHPTEPIGGVEPAQSNDDIASLNPTQSAEPMQVLSEHEWEEWKRHYWRDERLRKKNEKFLSAVSRYIDEASKLLDERSDIPTGAIIDAVKAKLRKLLYESRVLFYRVTAFHQGVVTWKSEGDTQSLMPILWASNGRIGVTSCILFNSYLQHEPPRLSSFRIEWNGSIFLFELQKRPDSRIPNSAIDWYCVPKLLVKRIQTEGTPYPEELHRIKLNQKQKDDLMGFIYLLKDRSPASEMLEINITVPEDGFVILAGKDFEASRGFKTSLFIAKWQTEHYDWITEDKEPSELTPDLWAQLKNRFK